MRNLTQTLYGDLARQYELEGLSNVHPTFFRLLRRLLHPRFLPIVFCRGSRWAMLHRIPVLPRLLTYLNIVMFGLEVTPRCEIGSGVFFPHTSGTVIGAARIGNNVIVFQGVTLGAKVFDRGFNPALRPTVGDGVTLGAGCKVLGGITIGDNVTVGANSVVVKSIAPNKTVAGIPAQEIAASANDPG